MRRACKKRRSEQSYHDNGNKKKIEKKIKKGQCSYIPEEIQRQILLRLPAKSLLRFRSLNKWSYSLTSTQQFVTDHLNTFPHQSKKQFLLLPPERLYTSISKPLYCKFVDGSVQPVYKQDLEPPPPPIREVDNHLVRVVGYCDGVVCMIRGWCHIQLWNPSIRKMTEVVCDSIPHDLNYGKLDGKTFGFGSVDGEHKLIILPDYYRFFSAYVFSMKTRNWATVRGHHTASVRSSERSAFVNGSCHWLAWERGTCFVLSFNLKEHTFGKIDLPNHLGLPSKLSVYNGCLSLIATAEQEDLCFVWVMTKYDVVESWTRIMEKKFKVHNRRSRHQRRRCPCPCILLAPCDKAQATFL